MSGINDVYTVREAGGRYALGVRHVFKVYRHGWRTVSQVQDEVDLVSHLRQQGIGVAAVVPRTDGKTVSVLSAPEGERAGVLFEYAPGRQPTWPFYRDTNEAYLLGAALADIHTAARNFPLPNRPALDADYLIHHTLALAMPLLGHRPEDDAFLQRRGKELTVQWEQLAQNGLTPGICHGDFHCGNVFLDGAKTTAFDFDVCGTGFLAFDFARWKTLAGNSNEGQASFAAFRAGYRSRGTWNETDDRALPLFEQLRIFDQIRLKADLIIKEQWNEWDWDFMITDALSALRAV